MFSVAIQGYGIVVWQDDGDWRVFTATDSLSARLRMRVEEALRAVPARAGQAGACEALLAISGAGLLSLDCDHAAGECDGEHHLS